MLFFLYNFMIDEENEEGCLDPRIVLTTCMDLDDIKLTAIDK